MAKRPLSFWFFCFRLCLHLCLLMGCNPTLRGTRHLNPAPCLQGDTYACRDLAEKLRRPRRRAGFLALGCTDGDELACEELRHVRFPRDSTRRFLLETSAGCRNEKPEYCHAMGRVFEQGAGVRRDLGIARALYFRGCLRHNGSSCEALGTFLRYGRGGHSDLAGAGLHYLRGCDLADGPSCYRLARLLDDYPQVISTTSAREMDERACILGDDRSCERLRAAKANETDTNPGAPRAGE